MTRVLATTAALLTIVALGAQAPAQAAQKPPTCGHLRCVKVPTPSPGPFVVKPIRPSIPQPPAPR